MENLNLNLTINDFRSLITVCGMLCFLVICFWAYHKNSQNDFSEAANLPLCDDEIANQNPNLNANLNSAGK